MATGSRTNLEKAACCVSLSTSAGAAVDAARQRGIRSAVAAAGAVDPVDDVGMLEP